MAVEVFVNDIPIEDVLGEWPFPQFASNSIDLRGEESATPSHAEEELPLGEKPTCSSRRNSYSIKQKLEIVEFAKKTGIRGASR